MPLLAPSDSPPAFVVDIGSVCTERLLLADFLAGSFHKVKLRQKQRNCVSCGVNREINTENLASYDYKLFTGQDYNDRLVSQKQIAKICREQRGSNKPVKLAEELLKLMQGSIECRSRPWGPTT